MTAATLLPSLTQWLKYGWRSLPSILVFSALGGVFWFGAVNHWKWPRAGAIWGSSIAADNDDWCTAHLVPETVCVECRQELRPSLPEFGWCRAHGVAECVLCHPELAQLKRPAEPLAYDTAAAIALRPRNRNNSRSDLHKKVVQFSSAEAVANSGIEVDVVATAPLREEITAHGEVRFDPTHVAHLACRVPGAVVQVFKQPGETVRAGELLAVVDALAVGEAKSELLRSLGEYHTHASQMQRQLAAADAIAGRARIETESKLRASRIQVLAARQRLLNLGFDLPEAWLERDPESLAEELRSLGLQNSPESETLRAGRSNNLMPLTAPIDGVIVSADLVRGELVSPEKVVLVIANPLRLWLTLQVREEDAELTALGQEVRFRTDHGAAEVTGKIDWISPAVDSKTRTLPVRVPLSADAASERLAGLRDRSFGQGRILLRSAPKAIVAPEHAVQSAGDVHVIFVRDRDFFTAGAPKFFHVRQVRLGAAADGRVELLAGALPGEVIATQGSGILLAQLLRSQLGAGCGCHDE